VIRWGGHRGFGLRP